MLIGYFSGKRIKLCYKPQLLGYLPYFEKKNRALTFKKMQYQQIFALKIDFISYN